MQIRQTTALEKEDLGCQTLLSVIVEVFFDDFSIS
jgi:hypothetical protein